MSIDQSFAESTYHVLDQSSIYVEPSKNNDPQQKKQERSVWEGILTELKEKRENKDSDAPAKSLNQIKAQIQSEEPFLSPIVISQDTTVSGVWCTAEVKGLLAVGCFDGKILLYSISSLISLVDPFQILNSHSGTVTQVGISNDKRYLASSSRDKSVIIWIQSGRDNYVQHQKLENHKDEVHALWLSGSGDMLVTGSEDQTLIIWKRSQTADQFYLSQHLVNHKERVGAVCISQSGNYILSGSADNLIWKWKFYYEESQFIGEGDLKGHTSEVLALCITKNDRRIISGSRDCTIIIWEMSRTDSSNEIILRLQGHTRPITSLRISIDEKLIFSTSRDGTIRTWRMTKNSLYVADQVLEEHSDAVTSISLSSENQYFITSGTDNFIKLWGDKQSEQKSTSKQLLAGLNSKIGSLMVSKSNQFIIVGTMVDTIKIWKKNVKRGPYLEFQELKGHKTPVYSATISENDEVIVSTSRDHMIIVWLRDRKQGFFREWQTLQGHKNAVTTAAISRQNEFIVSGSMDKAIKVWVRGNGNLYSEIKRRPHSIHDDFISSVTICSDNKTILSSSFDQSIRIWSFDINRQELIPQENYLEHKDPVFSVICADNMEYILAAIQGDKIKIWKKMLNEEDKEEEEEEEETLGYIDFQIIDGLANNVSSVSMTKDNKFIATGSKDKKIIIYKMNHDFYDRFIQIITPGSAFVYISYDGEYIAHGEYESGETNGGEMILGIVSFIQNQLQFPEDYNNLSLVQNVFVQDSRKSRENMEILIDHLADSYKNSPNDVFIHHSFNILFFCMVLDYIDCFKTALFTFGYKQSLYHQDFEPLQHAIKVDNPVYLDFFAEYFIEMKVDVEINKEIFIKGLQCSSDKFKIFISEIFFVKGRYYNIELQDTLRLQRRSDAYFFITDRSYSRMDRFAEKLAKDEESQRKNGSPLTKVEYLSSNFPVNLAISSEFVIKLLKQLDDTSDEVLLGNIGFLIKELWRRYRFLVIIYAFIHWSTTLLAIYLTLYNKKFIILIVLTGFNIVILFLYELIVMSVDFKKYLSSPYNWIDLLTNTSLFVLVVVLNPFGFLDDKNKLHNFLQTFLLLLAGGRSVTHLKVIDGMRYLIGMIIQVFVDMRYFMLLLAINIFLFGCIFEHTSKTNDEIEENTLLSAFKGLDYVYNLGYGAWDNTNEYTANQYFYFFIGTIFFPLIMFNLLIAIISATFERVEQSKELNDIKGTIDVLMDYSLFASAFKKRTNIEVMETDEEDHYIHLIKQKREDQKEHLDNVIQSLVEKMDLISAKFT